MLSKLEVDAMRAKKRKVVYNLKRFETSFNFLQRKYTKVSFCMIDRRKFLRGRVRFIRLNTRVRPFL